MAQREQVTVHTVGANMSSDETGDQGVTTMDGELFTGSGKDCHHGLVVMDASIIPAALGVNPFATITTLAECSVECVAAKMGITINYDMKNSSLDLFGPPEKKSFANT
jgi:hypothetical protein